MIQRRKKQNASKKNDEDHIDVKKHTKAHRIEKGETSRASRSKINAENVMKNVLEAEHKRFNNVLETLPVYLILLTPDYHVPFANRFFRERFGESKGKRCFEYLFGRTEPCETCETYTTLKTMRPHRWEWLGPDGHWYDIYDMPFIDADGSTHILEMGVDITDRKKTEKEILQYQEKLEELVKDRTAELERKNDQLAFDIVALQKAEDDIRSTALFPHENPYPVMRVSVDGKLLYANPASAELLEEWQTHVGAFIPIALQRTAEVAAAKGAQQKLEIQCRMHDYSFTLVPIVERGYINFYGNDITEHKKAERELLDSRERYKELVSNANSIIIRMDQNGTVTFFNEYAQKFFGYSLDEILGKNVRIIVPLTESSGKDLSKIIENILKNPDEFEENINENIRRNGERAWISWRNKAIKDSTGNVIGNLAIGSDITERFLAEKALKESESVLHAFFNSPGVMRGIVEVIEEDDILHITDNSEAAAFVGMTPGAMKNKKASELGQPPDIRRMWIKRYIESKQSGRPVTFEYRDKRGDTDVWLNATVTYMGISTNGCPRFSYVSFDDTERRLAENRLRETRDYLDSLISYANAPIIIWEPSRMITRFNRAFEYMTGYGSGEVIGLDLDILFPETSRDESLAKIAHTLKGAHWESVEIPILRKDGEVRIALWNSANIYSADGSTIVATIAQGQDITERKQTENQLKEVRDYLDSLIKYANAPIIVWAPSLKITRFNQAFEILTEYKSDDVVGRDLEILFPESSRKDSLAKIINTLSGEYWESVEIPILRKDGEVRVALWNSANIYAADGSAIVATIAQGQDITKLKQTQEALYRSEAHFKLLSETAEQLIMWENVQPVVNELCKQTMAHLDCHVFFNFLMNEKAGRLHLNAYAGIPDEEARKIEWLDYGAAVCGCVARDEMPIIAEDIWNKPDIRTDLVRSYGIKAYACHPIIIKNKVIGTLSFGTKTRTSFSQEDIILMKRVTAQVASAMERARLLNEIQQTKDELETRVQERTADLEKINEALGRSNLALEDFAHVASHDLQEPLRKIRTFADRLMSMGMISMSDQSRDYLSRMLKAAERMQLLIQDLLKYSRITSNPHDFKLFNLRAPVEDAVKDLAMLLEDTQGRVEINDLPDVMANEIQMRQLFQNLIANGLKYCYDQKPTIKIYSIPSSVDMFHEIYVEDNGIGFDEKYLDIVFKPFQRLHGKESPYPGTGMGLAICRKILEFHGGSISAISTPGKGSTFIVKLPKIHR